MKFLDDSFLLVKPLWTGGGKISFFSTVWLFMKCGKLDDSPSLSKTQLDLYGGL
jgi:hypothetical protein